MERKVKSKVQPQEDVRIQEFLDMWNEDLKTRHGLTPIPSGEHPKLALLPQMCEELLTRCEELQEVKDPDAILREYHRKLEPLLFSGKTMKNTELARTIYKVWRQAPYWHCKRSAVRWSVR